MEEEKVEKFDASHLTRLSSDVLRLELSEEQEAVADE